MSEELKCPYCNKKADHGRVGAIDGGQYSIRCLNLDCSVRPSFCGPKIAVKIAWEQLTRTTPNTDQYDSLLSLEQKVCVEEMRGKLIKMYVDQTDQYMAELKANTDQLVEALNNYRIAQSRMLDKWADASEEKKRELWKALHDCEEPALEALEPYKGS